MAAEHSIPVVENIPLACETQIGHAIRPKWFKQVAEILVTVYKLERGAV